MIETGVAVLVAAAFGGHGSANAAESAFVNHQRAQHDRTSAVQVAEIRHTIGDALEGLGIRHVTEENGGKIELVLDQDRFDFHIDAKPGHDSRALGRVIDKADRLGYEVMDEDECPAQVLADGSMRVYLVPIIPQAVSA